MAARTPRGNRPARSTAAAAPAAGSSGAAFGSGLGTETGGSASSTAVRALIKQFVDAEDARKPLSDAKLADMLKEQGIECARRTVAKYREQLKIPTTTLRKAL